MAGAEYLTYYPPWRDYRLGTVNYEDLEFTLSNLSGDPNKPIGEAEVTVSELWYEFRNGDTTWGELESNMDWHYANEWRCEECIVKVIGYTGTANQHVCDGCWRDSDEECTDAAECERQRERYEEYKEAECKRQRVQ